MAETAFKHHTVLRRETVELLAAGPGRTMLDGTLGGGGHSEAMLEAGATVIGLDQDPRALTAATERLKNFEGRFTAAHANFRDARGVLDGLNVGEVDGALVDLGVSSPQLDDAARGFSFRGKGPLDMRMDTTRGAPLSEKLREWDERALASLIFTLSEEKFSRPIAREIKRAVEADEVHDTGKLADLVANAIPRKAWPKEIHPATRTFQALRIAVNDELGALAEWLLSLPRLIKKGGRAAAISFHSLEDRMVKQAFAKLATGCICPPQLPVCACGRSAEWSLVMKGAVQASDEEVAVNPRSRSARLRAVERLR
ncbi:MAG: 16S rRNA (cytosine(1402)-N(4))-methyltransferase RsmH [Deltaproteobacteria bacterium]|nr:16S rRNA (cytosine(1402)-N(4))-methyltransferase RsmH [Deltaproteobacteria bacterium]